MAPRGQDPDAGTRVVDRPVAVAEPLRSGSPMVGDPEARGRTAGAPHEIPARGWKDVARRVKDEARHDHVALLAAGVAFFSLIALVPAMGAVVALYGLVADPADVTAQVEDLTSALPESAADLLNEQMTAVASSEPRNLSIGLAISLVVALWAASAATKNLMVAINAAYDEAEGRGFLRLRGTALLLTAIGVLVLVGSVVLLTFLPALVERAVDWDGARRAASLARWPLLVVLMMAGLAAVYRYAPDRDQPRWRWVTWGAGLATTLWILASIGFSVYAATAGSYNETYGALAGVIVFMVWLHLTMICVILGAEVNAELEHQTARDSTVGPERPLGARGATVADTVAGPATAVPSSVGPSGARPAGSTSSGARG